MNTSKRYNGHEQHLFLKRDTAIESFSSSVGDTLVCTQVSPDKQTGNEDAAGLFFDQHNQSAVLVIADGMGGAPLGDMAAEIVIQSIQSEIRQNDAADGNDTRLHILDAIDQANQRIADLKVGAGSTCALLEIDNTTVRPYHVGDSSIMIVGQRGKIKFQSIAHSPVGYALEAGHLEEEEALSHENLHEISNYVGHSGMRIDIGPTVRLGRRDTVLLGSDGLFDNLRNEEIVELIRTGNLQRCAKKLIALIQQRMQHTSADNPSKPDDVVFILFRRNH